MSVLRNGHVPCHSFCNIHVNFKMIPYPMSTLGNTLCRVKYFFPHVARLHVDFKKWPCHSVKLMGHEPHYYHNNEIFEDLILLPPSEIKQEVCELLISV